MEKVISHVVAVSAAPGKAVSKSEGSNGKPTLEHYTSIKTGLNLWEVMNKLVMGDDRHSTLIFLHHVSCINSDGPGH